MRVYGDLHPVLSLRTSNPMWSSDGNTFALE